jgi:hypothetical protein
VPTVARLFAPAPRAPPLQTGGLDKNVHSNESHSAYLAKKRLFANVTNLSHAIANVHILFSVFEPE